MSASSETHHGEQTKQDVIDRPSHGVPCRQVFSTRGARTQETSVNSATSIRPRPIPPILKRFESAGGIGTRSENDCKVENTRLQSLHSAFSRERLGLGKWPQPRFCGRFRR